MIKKMILAMSLLGLSMSGAHASTTLNFNGSYSVPNENNLFYFINRSVGDVRIVVDTLTDGLDAEMTVWAPTDITNASLPMGRDWAMVQWVPDGGRPNPETGLNDFGIPFRNGYIPNNPFNPGTSDPGVDLRNLAIGAFLVTVSGNFNIPNETDMAGTPMSFGFTELDHLNPMYNQFPLPRAYTLTISGNISEIPVPAAVWLLGTALAGLGFVRKRYSPVQSV